MTKSKMDIRDNVLFFGGVSTVKLVEQYQTPLYVMDETTIRNNCKKFQKIFSGNNNKVAYAGKAFLTLEMCKILNDEKMYLDVVSGGELFTAKKAKFPMERIYFHGNNKTNEELQMGVDYQVGTFVVDNFSEVLKINQLAKQKNIIQNILLRVNPSINVKTHDYIKTGHGDSKFGFNLFTNEIVDAINYIKELTNVEFIGLHCHIGSQLFDIQSYEEEVQILFSLVKRIHVETGVIVEEVNLGGGFGIAYLEEEQPPAIEEFCGAILKKAIKEASELEITLPRLVIEPGRSIVGEAGIMLYQVGYIKDIPNIKKIVSVDGGMADHIRPALYQAKYHCVVANRINSNIKEKVTVVGKCCESGDVILNDVVLPKIQEGDLIVLRCTGAYGYSMVSNYNKIRKPAVVMVRDKEARLICKRQSYEQLIEDEL